MNVRRERGAATVLMVAVTGVAGLLVAVVGLLGQVAVLGQRARNAADLAALAAAGAAEGWVSDDGGPCAVARAVASANGARLSACVIESSHDATVSVAVTAPGAVARAGGVRASARAGPA